MKTTSLVCVLLNTTLCFEICSLSAAAGKKDPQQNLSAPTPHAEGVQVGRYQIFNGKYESSTIVNADSKSELKEGLFILDSATGQLFECDKSTFQLNNQITIRSGCADFEHKIQLGGKDASN
jgi:hypothetical protein